MIYIAKKIPGTPNQVPRQLGLLGVGDAAVISPSFGLGPLLESKSLDCFVNERNVSIIVRETDERATVVLLCTDM